LRIETTSRPGSRDVVSFYSRFRERGSQGHREVTGSLAGSTVTSMFGQRIKRVEDPALLQGAARFADDIHYPDMVHAHFVRSAYAHARITSIDVMAARKASGVHAVYTYDDLAPHFASDHIPGEMPNAAIRQTIKQTVLARDEVCHVGEGIAMIVADSRALAEDAAEQVIIDYEPLPAVIDLPAALADGSPTARTDCSDNVVARFVQDFGDTDAAFGAAAHVASERFTLHKGGGHPVECRGVVARYDSADNVLTVWDGTQMPHRAHGILVDLLGCAETEVRIVPPDVGGGFGPKFVFYPEEAAVPLASKLLRRPVKWIEDRREHFTATVQERDQLWEIEAAVDSDGRLLGIRGRMLHDHGAFTPYGIVIAQNAATNLLGPYVLPACRLEVVSVLTNLIPATPTRGAGRPQGTYAMERLLDRVAQDLNIDRAEIRRRNLIGADQMPYATPVRSRDGATMIYDSGDYPASQAKLLAAVGYDDFPAQQSAARAEGRHIGLGIANYVEGTGRGPFESATVSIGASGKVEIRTGATAQGQGVKTTLAQLCAGSLGVDPAEISVITGDTSAASLGLGAFASRQAVNAGSSVHLAVQEVREKALDAASRILEAAKEDLEVADATVRVKGVSGLSVSLGDIARVLGGMPGYAMPSGLAPGLSATAHFSPDALTYCNGSHAAVVEVDVETGQVAILRYVVVHDSGRLINPMLVEGQVHGGVAHGISAALYEWMKYDENGQPQTTNLGEYLMPTAPEVPRIEIHHMESPTPLNPLGVKGAGECGTIPATAVLASAVENALSPFSARVTDIPMTPERILNLIDGSG